MKKLCCFILVALLALLCATALADCATDGHRCDCTTPDVCFECGATGVTGEITHSFENEIKYETDATRHFVYCAAGCGELLIDEEHYIKCNGSSTTCYVCGEPASAIRHDFSDVGYDAENHWRICVDCGATDEKYTHDYDYCVGDDGLCNTCGAPTTNVMHTDLQFVSQVPGNCVAGTVSTYKCGDCGETEVYTDPCTGECYYTQMFDETGHWVACTGCGEVTQEKSDHMIPCDKPGTCKFCKVTGLTGEGQHWFMEQGYDAKQHWYICEACGEKGQVSDHYLPCDSDAGVCQHCGYACEPTSHASVTGTWQEYSTCAKTGVMLFTCDNCGVQWSEDMPADPDFHDSEEIAYVLPNCKEEGYQIWKCKDCGFEEKQTFGEAGECSYEFENAGATHKYVCTGCGKVDFEEPHYISCKGGSTCAYCGATGVSGEVSHYTGEAEYDANGHWFICLDCGEKLWADVHWTLCDMSKTECINCAYTGSNIAVDHYFNYDDVKYDAAKHWWVCTKCSETCYAEAHFDSESKPTGKCVICSQLIPSEEHECAGKAVTVTAATCTGFGLEQTVCDTCGKVIAEKQLLPTGHYWLVTKTIDATADKEGRIEYACRDCDAGSLKRLPATGVAEEAPAEEAPAEEVAEATEETAEVPVKAIENVTVEAAEGEALSSDVALIVNEPETDADVAAILPEEIKETVAKVYFVKLTEKGEEIEVAGSLKIAIELEEGADLTGKKLMLLKEDGTLVEIEYEVVEGKLVFVTDAVGTFVLVDAPAE